MNKNKQRFNNYSREYKDAKEYQVNAQEELISFLLANVNQSRNAIKGMLTHHYVSVNGAPISQYNFMLEKGDVVLISKKPIYKKGVTNKTLDIIYEDDDIIVINKPSGLLTIASDKEKGRTAYRLITEYVQTFNKHNRVYVVHRIDEDTSGVLMFCKNQDIRDAWQDKWNDLVLDRGYYAIVEGQLDKKKGLVKSYLKQNKLNLMYSSDDKVHGKLAITNYEVIKENDKYSLLDIHIDSGRKNQIRVHMGDLHHNIIGDDKYGNPSNPIDRLGLHAYCLKIKHPISGKTYTFKAKMPKVFDDLMNGNIKEKVKKPIKKKNKK